MSRRLSYPKEIKESVEELRQTERHQTKALFRDRVRYIRLLKSGHPQGTHCHEGRKSSALPIGHRYLQIARRQCAGHFFLKKDTFAGTMLPVLIATLEAFFLKKLIENLIAELFDCSLFCGTGYATQPLTITNQQSLYA